MVEQPEKLTSLKNPFKLVINTFLVLFVFLLLLYLAIEGFHIFGPPEYRDKADFLQKEYLNFVSQAWIFVRPLVQLVIILAIVEWILKRLGISLFSEKTKFEWTIQTVIAVILVSAFAIVALGAGEITALKDLALVVVGFYFGTQKKQVE